MTAEVAILNRSAVAIAADSAVTLGMSDPKIYNTANKLFALSEAQPVAIMIYGAGSFGPIPWETVIKEYRTHLASTVLDHISEYASNFIQYLDSLLIHIPVDQEHALVETTVTSELLSLRNFGETIELIPASRGAGPHHDQERTRLLLEHLDNRLIEIESVGYIDGISNQVATEQIKTLYPDWDHIFDKQANLTGVSQQVRAKAKEVVCAALRVAGISPQTSGIVVTGFGSKQVFPALAHYVVDGVLANVVRARKRDEVIIGNTQTASIRPFAQNDMVMTFMDGIDPGYQTVLHSFVDETIALFAEHFGSEIREIIPDSVYVELTSKMLQARRDTVEHFDSQLEEFLASEASQPIMSIIEFLPKEELAVVAETLVQLTSFKLRLTPASETVGGPIDVAVISKGDGLVWIKRKHYFPPELNARYFQRLGLPVNTATATTGGQP